MNEQLQGERNSEQVRAEFSTWLTSDRFAEVAKAMAHKSIEGQQDAR